MNRWPFIYTIGLILASWGVLGLIVWAAYQI